MLEIFKGLTIDKMEHIKEESNYNHNYYRYGKWKLLEICDDNHIGEWYIVGIENIYIGYIDYNFKEDGIILEELT